jgi:uncharacterized protein YbjT (DUF2867 family)
MSQTSQKQARVFVVSAATGQIGRKIALGLLAAGQSVRALTRDAAKAQDLAAAGADVLVGNPEDQRYVERALTGADAFFALLPPHYGADDMRAYQNLVGKAQAAAIAASGVRKVVNLSSVGAQHGEGVGPIKGLHDQEQRLNALAGVDVLHLRPTYFLENILFATATIRGLGLVGTPLRPDVRFPQIATADIAAKAVERLLALDFTAKSVQELLGPSDVTMTEVTAAVAQAIQRPELKYAQFPYDAALEAMAGAGMSRDAATQMVELYRAINDGLFKPERPRTAASTTPTRIETLARELAPALIG